MEFSTELDPIPADASPSHSYMPNVFNKTTKLGYKAFNDGDYSPEIQTDDLRKYLELSEYIVAISRNRFTPFHLTSISRV